MHEHTAICSNLIYFYFQPPSILLLHYAPLTRESQQHVLKQCHPSATMKHKSTYYKLFILCIRLRVESCYNIEANCREKGLVNK